MGYYYEKKKKENKALKASNRELQQAAKNRIDQDSNMNLQRENIAKDLQQDYQRGRMRADEVLGRRYQGLTPEQRMGMEEQGTRGINRQMQGYQRQLTAQQGQRGIRGGAAYAQNADLARIGAEAQQGLQSNLSDLEADLALKKLAAAFNIEQGEASQAQLERQRVLDEQRRIKEEARQEKLAREASRAFSRIKG